MDNNGLSQGNNATNPAQENKKAKRETFVATISPGHAVYVISVAAELAGVHPQTLRIYERKGLLDPSRTSGGSRRYSERDVAMMRRIQELTSEGLNLEGVKRVLDLEREIESLRNDIEAIKVVSRRAVEDTHKKYRRDLVPLNQWLVPHHSNRDVRRRD
ncbi:MAG: helix-turn-helix transcriptional regulator [Acidimicrobiales bacterium]|nr:helix-turn-helix transcriptional regulator [Acidimicrobiales bacterium]